MVTSNRINDIEYVARLNEWKEIRRVNYLLTDIVCYQKKKMVFFVQHSPSFNCYHHFAILIDYGRL
jgi:hypothetical protein